MQTLALRESKGRRAIPVVILFGAIAATAWIGGIVVASRRGASAKVDRVDTSESAAPVPLGPGMIRLTALQQSAIGIEVAPVKVAASTDLLEAPGQVVPDETKYAYITPRASGVVRAVAAHEGQRVKAGDLLATVDSHEVAEARFALVAALQELEVARSQADWQQRIYQNTLSLLECLKAGDTPAQIATRFEDKPVGTNRQQLITAYSNQKLSKVSLTRQQDLNNQGILPMKQVEEARAEYESAEATYKSLTEQMAFNSQLEHTKTQQGLRKAETSARVARALLRVYGLDNDAGMPKISADGKVVGVNPDGTLADPKNSNAVDPNHLDNHAAISDRPVSSYEIVAPFDGIILDRMMMVPGVYVEVANRIFTLADLSTVWIEVNVHENSYGLLDRSRESVVHFTSPAYPGKRFEGQVIYRGDLVDPKSRTLKLMASAKNTDGLLKPGMFVDVEVRIPGDRKAALVPTTALLTEGDAALVFVKVGPDRFERREVSPGPIHGTMTEIFQGLKEGEVVVVSGGFKLKAESELEEERGVGSPGNSPEPSTPTVPTEEAQATADGVTR